MTDEPNGNIAILQAELGMTEGENNTNNYAPYKAKYIYHIDYKTLIRVGK